MEQITVLSNAYSAATYPTSKYAWLCNFVFSTSSMTTEGHVQSFPYKINLAPHRLSMESKGVFLPIGHRRVGVRMERVIERVDG